MLTVLGVLAALALVAVGLDGLGRLLVDRADVAGDVWAEVLDGAR